MAFENKDKVRFLRVIAGNHNGFLCIAITNFRVELQCNRSLAARRDCPVKMGNGTTSAGEYLFYVQDGLADIFDIEFVDKFPVLGKLSEIVSRFWNFNSRSFIGGGS
jgi:hypothetical protein